MKNPFSPSFPVDPENFVNRVEVIESFRTAIGRSVKSSSPKPDNIAILGDWGVGKSSVLRKFEWLCTKEFKDRKIFSALVELGPSSSTSLETFSAKIMDDIDRSVISKSSLPLKAKNEIKEWRIKSVKALGIEAEKRSGVDSPATLLKDSLLKLWGIVEREGGDTMLLMLDDLHYLSERHSDSLYDLRGVLQNLPKDGCNFVVAVSGKSELFADIRELAEPLSRFFNIKHTLAPFGLEETNAAINKPIEKAGLDLSVDKLVTEEIHRLTEGHPYFIHFIMRELVSKKGSGKITEKVFHEAYKGIQKAIEREKFDIDYSIASPKEKEVLLEAANLPTVFSPSDFHMKEIRTQLGILVKKGLLKKFERGEYAIYHPLFRSYLKQKKTDAR